MHDVIATRKRTQHISCFGNTARLSKRDAITIDDGVGGDDDHVALASGNGPGLLSGVMCRQLARAITGTLSFVEIAWDDAYVQTESGQQFEAPWRCACENDRRQFA
ncbi:MAG: hypothetical protein NVS2B8_10080 [Vulcanimicrobiaceae bacterium]